MMIYFSVGIGGMLGSLARFVLGRMISEKSNVSFPLGTFVINLSGAILLGVVTSLGMGDTLYALFGEGFLGAYTTFSTFMYEGFNLFAGNEKINALVYILGSMVISIIGYTMGMMITGIFI